ncbi:hypothetical protein [Paraliomyxa miuraensis]|nr:hypothetical protein [Paraliomyxa miuraensis]MCX4239229.1 hypothetical protein [Paraliomyxa miuraensis]
MTIALELDALLVDLAVVVMLARTTALISALMRTAAVVHASPP